MRAMALVALLLAGCTAGPGAAPPSDSPSASPAAPSTTAATATAPPTAPPSATPVPATTYTADDEEIAMLIRASTAEAIAQLKLLNDMDPQKLEDLFLPLGEWITSKTAAIAAYTPSSCTAPAVELFMEGMAQYDDIREKFLAWRDWGAQGNAFPPTAPPAAVRTFEAALVELEATCPA